MAAPLQFNDSSFIPAYVPKPQQPDQDVISYYIILFVGFFSMVGVFSGITIFYRRSVGIWYTPAVFITGILLAYLYHLVEWKYKWDEHGNTIFYAPSMVGDLFMFFTLPPLIFQNALNFDPKKLKRCFLLSFSCAFFKVSCYATVIGTFIKLLLPYGWSWSVSFLIGSILSATDPSSMVDLLEEQGLLGLSYTFLELTALCSSGPYTILINHLERLVSCTSTIIPKMTFISFLRFLKGLLVGIISFTISWVAWYYFRRFRPFPRRLTLLIFISIIMSYLAFGIAEKLYSTGIFALVALGILFKVFGMRAKFEPRIELGATESDTREPETTLEDIWTLMSHVANIVTFALSGVIIMQIFLRYRKYHKVKDWWSVLFLYLFIHSFQIIGAMCLLLLAHLFGYRSTRAEKWMLAFSEIEGAGAFFTILSFRAFNIIDSSGNPIFPPKMKAEFFCLVGGIVTLTSTVDAFFPWLLAKLMKRHNENLDRL